MKAPAPLYLHTTLAALPAAVYAAAVRRPRPVPQFDAVSPLAVR